ncbi:hypothetical protein EJ02DRAFT_455879, partial [Clathrospora elynae]
MQSATRLRLPQSMRSPLGNMTSEHAYYLVYDTANSGGVTTDVGTYTIALEHPLRLGAEVTHTKVQSAALV